MADEQLEAPAAPPMNWAIMIYPIAGDAGRVLATIAHPGMNDEQARDMLAEILETWEADHGRRMESGGDQGDRGDGRRPETAGATDTR